MGPFFTMLMPWAADGVPNYSPEFSRWLEIDGFDGAQRQAIINAIGGQDGRPSSIRITHESSQQYTEKLNKLLWVIRFAGIVFTGEQVRPNAMVEETPSEGLFDSRPERTTNKAAKEMMNK